MGTETSPGAALVGTLTVFVGFDSHRCLEDTETWKRGNVVGQNYSN